MKVLVTGAKGFIGQNLCLALRQRGHEVFEYDLGSTDDELKAYLVGCDFIVHLAGVNRPLNPQEFVDGNVNFTKKLLDYMELLKCAAPLIFSSSTQAELDNPYGASKKMAEDEIFAFSKAHNHPVYVFRLYNAFGKWCRPNYNSVIATFCYNTAHNIPLQVNEAAPAINFVYIDDICDSFISIIEKRPMPTDAIIYAEPHYSVTLREIVDALAGFKKSRENLEIPNLKPGFFKDLYSTYLSYLDETDFAYSLNTHADQRGSFTEMFKTGEYGQVSVNIGKPGIVKGNHYHMSKNEKYVVVQGTCAIKFRKVGTDKVITYTCSGKDMKVVDIPPGYTHSITNIGTEDSITIMWANEPYDPNHPDTIYLPVEQEKK
jgi:UDP-2-acetamido-2,6-beta-L-arabino-hexul-4-ose reductase